MAKKELAQTDVSALPMKVEIDSQQLAWAIGLIQKLANPYGGNINVICTDGSLFLESRADVSNIKIEMPTVSGEGTSEFGISLESLRLATAGRVGQMTLTFENQRLNIAMEDYKVALATVDVVQTADTVLAGDPSTVHVTKELASWFNQAVSTVALKPSTISPIMPCAIKLSAEGALVCCYARDHLSVMENKEITGDMSLNIPVDTASAIFSCFDGTEFDLTTTASMVQIKSETVNYIAVLPATDAYIEMDALLVRISMMKNGMVKEGEVAPWVTFSLDGQKLLKFLASCKAIAVKTRQSLAITNNKDKLLVSCETHLGKLKMRDGEVADNASVELKVDLEYFAEATRNCKDKVTIKCLPGKYILVNQPSSYTVIAMYMG